MVSLAGLVLAQEGEYRQPCLQQVPRPDPLQLLLLQRESGRPELLPALTSPRGAGAGSIEPLLAGRGGREEV